MNIRTVSGEEIENFPNLNYPDAQFFKTGAEDVVVSVPFGRDTIYIFCKRNSEGKWFEILRLHIPGQRNTFWNTGGMEAHELIASLAKGTSYRLVIEAPEDEAKAGLEEEPTSEMGITEAV